MPSPLRRLHARAEVPPTLHKRKVDRLGNGAETDDSHSNLLGVHSHFLSSFRFVRWSSRI